MESKYWIGVASRDHALHGVEKGIAQLGHGKRNSLQKMKPGDRIIYYSPVNNLKEKKNIHRFTALGKIKNGKYIRLIWEMDSSLSGWMWSIRL